MSDDQAFNDPARCGRWPRCGGPRGGSPSTCDHQHTPLADHLAEAQGPGCSTMHATSSGQSETYRRRSGAPLRAVPSHKEESCKRGAVMSSMIAPFKASLQPARAFARTCERELVRFAIAL